MSTKTTIEWTDVTWNPVRGCSLVSAGCANCYAMKTAHRFNKPGMVYEGLTKIGPQGPRWNGNIRLVPEALDEPLHWKPPLRVFVNSMSDLFHDDVPDEFIDQIFITMGEAPRHTFQILTKRPQRMKAYMDQSAIAGESFVRWPLPNVWLGVSVEDQATADERIPILLQTPAAVRFISAEPLLGPVNLTRMPIPETSLLPEYGTSYGFNFNTLHRDEDTYMHSTKHHLDWVIVGGESGPGARPCDVQWIRSIKEQCREAVCPVFIKQLGAKPFAVEGSRAAREWSALGATAMMDDIVGIHIKDRKGGDMATWPEDLRVREFPQ